MALSILAYKFGFPQCGFHSNRVCEKHQIVAKCFINRAISNVTTRIQCEKYVIRVNLVENVVFIVTDTLSI